MPISDLSSEIVKTLERICVNCGEDWGKHRCSTDHCPEMEGRRAVGYIKDQYFKEQTDEQV